MFIVIYLALIVCIVGLLIWGLCVGVSKGWFAEVGRIAFAAGLLAFLMTAGATLSTCTSGSSGIHSR